MAINSTAVWRIRTGGNAANGAAYDSAISGAGTDYSQQDAAQLTVADGACLNNTTLTSASGGFTAAMIGNAVRIASGTNFTAGYYFITARADTNTVTLDRNPTNGSNATSGAVRVGGAARQPENVGTSLAAGNTVYVRASAGNAASYPTASLDYTISAFFSPTAGSAAAGYTKWIGENGMPTIDSPGLGFYNCAWQWWEGLYLVATATSNGAFGILNADQGSCIAKDCVLNLNLQAAVRGVKGESGGSQVIGCEIYGGSTTPTANSGADGVYANAAGWVIQGNRVRHCRGVGIFLGNSNSGAAVLGNLVYGCAGNGVESASVNSPIASIVGNTVDGNAGDGISLTGTNGAAYHAVRNNNVTGHAVSGKYGINVATSASDKRKNGWGHNNVWGNDTDYVNVTADATDLSVDPDYADAANGDFTPSEATLEGAAFPTGF